MSVSTSTRAYVALVAGSGALALGVGLATAGAPDTLRLLGALALAGGFLALEHFRVRFVWRGHRSTSSLIEAGIFLGLLALPGGYVALALASTRLGESLVARKPALKVAFNVGQGALAATVAALLYAQLAAAGVPMLFAAALATLAFSVCTEATIAVLFGVMERASPLRVYRERFALENALAAIFGVSFGAGAMALYGVHPLAALAIVPPFLLVVDHARLRARLEGGAPAGAST